MAGDVILRFDLTVQAPVAPSCPPLLEAMELARELRSWANGSRAWGQARDVGCRDAGWTAPGRGPTSLGPPDGLRPYAAPADSTNLGRRPNITQMGFPGSDRKPAPV